MRNVSKTLSLSKSPTEYKMNESITIMAVEAFKVTTITTGNKMENENKFKNDTQKNLKCHKLRINVHSHQISFKQTAATTIPTFPTDISPRISKTDISSRSILNILKSQIFSSLANHRLWLMLWLMATLIQHVKSYDMTTATKGTTSSAIRYSQLLSTNDNKSETIYEDTFRPFVPKDAEMIARNVFTPSGQFRVFQAIDTDLRATVALQMKHNSNNELLKSFGKSSSSSSTLNTNTATTSYSSLQQDYGEKEHKKRDHKTIEANVLHNANKPDTSNLAQIDKFKNQKQQQQQQQQLKHNQQHQLVTIKQSHGNSHLRNGTDIQHNEITNQDFLLDPNDTDLKTDFKNLEDLLVEYVTNFFEKGQYEPMPGLVVKLQNLNHSDSVQNLQSPAKTRNARQTKGVTDAKVQIDLPRTLASGRLLFLTGLKKVLWPVFIGLQVLKSLLIAMFIPAIIGSLTRLLGKGISTGSAPLFIRPIDPPQELDFRDNNINFDDDKFLVMNEGLKGNGPYAYNRPDASQMPNDYVFDPASANNQLTFTRLGMNERQHQLMQDSYMSALQSIGSASFKNSGSLSSSSSGLLAPMAKKPPPAANVNTYQQFQKVPDSSLLLSNYDPFYSPLLSRLDSVFAQLKINSDKEICREKVICLMYANPAKYAPYSNLVSAQLSRELNELRKPTSDNPDILRFFKYMRAAKDGQDGVDCEQTFDKCTEFKDFENPAMVSTYHDINKLVQARKLNNK